MHRSHDDYLATLTPKERAALEALSARIAARLPEGAQAVISYQIPAWQDASGEIVIGIAAFKSHINVTPFSGSIVPQIADRIEAEGFKTSKSAVRVPYDVPLPDWILDKLIRLKLDAIG